MGWMKDGKGIWGDGPQDIVDDAVRKLAKVRSLDVLYKWSAERKQAILKRLLANKTLKAKFDKPFLEEWDRKGTMAEFRSHLISALGGLK